MTPTIAHPPVDLEHLARQTGGNEALGREVLRMFLDGLPGDMARLRAAGGSERREAAHLIVGSARAIGAVEVGRAAAAIEAGSDDLATLEAAIHAVREFLAAYLSRP